MMLHWSQQDVEQRHLELLKKSLAQDRLAGDVVQVQIWVVGQLVSEMAFSSMVQQ